MAKDDNEETLKTAAEYYARAEERFNSGDLDGALADYDDVLQLESRNVYAMVNRGVIWNIKGEYDKAFDDFGEAIRQNRNHVEAWTNRGKVWVKMGEYDKALDDYTEAIRRNPNYAHAWNGRGIVWKEKEKYDKALKDFDKAILLKSDFVEAWSNRANVWFEKGEYDKFIADYSRAFQLAPNDKDIVSDRAVAWTLKATEPERKEIAKKVEEEYSKKLEEELREKKRQFTADTKRFRRGEIVNMVLYTVLQVLAMGILGGIAWGLFEGFKLIYAIEIKNGGLNWDSFFTWTPVVVAMSSPFFLLWWMLQRWSYESKTLSYGFQRKVIVEERLFRYTGDDAQFRKELLALYLAHWMEKSPLEVMLAIGGKGKSMGERNSFASVLLDKVMNWQKFDKFDSK